MRELKHPYKIINNLSELETLIGYCIKTGYCSFDFETSGKSPFANAGFPTILGVSFQAGSSWVIPLGHKDSIFKDNYIWVLREFGKRVIENPNITKICWNAQFEFKWCMKYGIYPKGRILDGMLAKYLLDEERPNGLKEMVARFLPYFTGYELPGSGSDKFDWANVDFEELSKYCALDSDLTLRLTLFFERLLIKYNFYRLYRNLLMMAVRTLVETEYKGMLVDVPYLDNLIEVYAKKLEGNEKRLRSIPMLRHYEKKRIQKEKQLMIEEISKEILAMEDTGGNERAIQNRKVKLASYVAGNYTTKKELKRVEPINFSSPKQLIDLLFTSKYGFKFKPLRFTDSDAPSTDEDTLQILKEKDKSGFINALLENREFNKLYSTYIAGMRGHIMPDNKIHASYLIHGTVTGRLSCLDFNELLLTNQGEIPIGELCPAHIGYKDIRDKKLLTLTHKGNWKLITTGINKGKAMMYKITFGNGHVGVYTLDHIFITTQGKVSLRDIWDETTGTIDETVKIISYHE